MPITVEPAKSFAESMGDSWSPDSITEQTCIAYDAQGNYCLVDVTVRATALDGSLWEGKKQLRLQMKRV